MIEYFRIALAFNRHVCGILNVGILCRFCIYIKNSLGNVRIYIQRLLPIVKKGELFFSTQLKIIILFFCRYYY